MSELWLCSWLLRALDEIAGQDRYLVPSFGLRLIESLVSPLNKRVDRIAVRLQAGDTDANAKSESAAVPFGCESGPLDRTPNPLCWNNGGILGY